VVLNPDMDKEEVDPKAKGNAKETKEKASKKSKKKKGKENLEVIGPGKSTHEFRKCIEDYKGWEQTDEVRNPEQRGNIDLLKQELLSEIENDVIKKVHKTIMEELTAISGVSKAKGTKKGKGKGKKKKSDDDDEKEDEESRKELEARKMDKMFMKKANLNLSRRDNFSEMVKHRFIRKIKPYNLDDMVGSFD